MVRRVFAYILLSVGVILGLYFGFSTDRRLHDEIVARCVAGNQLRHALHIEHLPRKAETLKTLRRFPVGVTILVNNKPLKITHKQLVKNYYIEKHVVEQTEPVKCP